MTSCTTRRIVHVTVCPGACVGAHIGRACDSLGLQPIRGGTAASTQGRRRVAALCAAWE